MTIGVNSGAILGVIGANFALGVIFACIVRRLAQEGLMEGYTAFMVAIGVGFTVAINQMAYTAGQSPLVDLIIEFAGFAASGVPMIVGDVQWYTSRRRNELRRYTEAVQHDPATQNTQCR